MDLLKTIIIANEAKYGKDASFAELERDAGLGNGTIKKWNVHHPRLDLLIKVADALDVSLDFLCERNQSPANPLSKSEKDLLEYFNALNSSGQEQAMIQIKSLAHVPDYQQDTDFAAVS